MGSIGEPQLPYQAEHGGASGGTSTRQLADIIAQDLKLWNKARKDIRVLVDACLFMLRVVLFLTGVSFAILFTMGLEESGLVLGSLVYLVLALTNVIQLLLTVFPIERTNIWLKALFLTASAVLALLCLLLGEPAYKALGILILCWGFFGYTLVDVVFWLKTKILSRRA